MAVMLTLPSVSSMSPTVTVCAASRRAVAVAPVLRNTLVALCVMEPVPAITSIEPLLADVLLVRMSAVPVKLTLPAPSTLMLPLPLMMSALAVMSVPAPRAWIRMLPVPKALMAVSSFGAVPLFKVIEPAVVRSTMFPLLLVTRSDWLLACAANAAALLTRCTVTVTVSTLTPSVSVM